MHILYGASGNFPNNRAHSVQIAHTCHALASLGVEVTLCVRELSEPSLEAAMGFYGLDVPEALSACALHDRSSRTRHKRLRKLRAYLRWKRFCAELRGRDDTFLYSRGPGGAKRLCQARASGSRPLLIFEAHKLEYQDVLDRARHSPADEAKVRRKTARMRNLEARVFRRMHGIACTTRAASEDIIREFKPTCPVRVIRNGADLHEPASAARDIDILYCGQLYAWKGVDTLVRAMPFVPDHRLTVVSGNKKEDVDRVRKLAADANVAGRIDFVGYVPPHQVPGYLARARVGVVPIVAGYSAAADRYTSPVKLFEYMVSGVAVVASDLPSVREVLEDGVTGKLVRPNSPEALADGIGSLLRDDSLTQQIAGRAREHVRQFTWESRAREIIDLLRCAAEQSSRTSDRSRGH